MLNEKILLASLAFISLASCTKDDETIPAVVAPTSFNYNIPATYTFERNSVTSVDYAGQTSRLLMLDEMGNYIKTAATTATAVDDAFLSDMYENKNNRFTGAGLNASGKQLKDKTAASKDYFSLYQGGGSVVEQTEIRNLYVTQFVNAKAASQGINASAGIAGIYTDGTSKRLFATNGLEPQQVLLKGMMGSCMMDQICNNYLSLNKLDEGTNRTNNTSKVLETGKSYTTMEHNWDEAYGYLYGADNTTTTPNTFKFWSSYINQVSADSDFNTLKADIDLAFRKGRAAIVANDYAVRDAQIDIIKAKIAMIPAVRAVYYLQEGKGKLTTANGAGAFHALSEAYGFILSLRYTNKPGTNNPYFTKAEVDTMLASMISGTNGLWDINTLGLKLDAISTQIAAKFGFTVLQAATVN
ncbi:TPA: DUF4856 domain-containing protein [Flavobacterium psychrophilum]|uniref:DUF4856 domain-containing protein n=1 Tax=Flavobacterium psychrophilum TaxID=96345 RepID=UPI00073EB1EE|nr:DUF4856 domain-containing protein [Flavobacterium psychrophilum]EKT4501894.1 DUF4856 domain-containing protein [Flavobacterium psychrophilum]SNB96889.1 conserved hypothetical protein [Flavobacterium psychrophilum]GAQ48829.1 hypothetical protein FPK15_contig00019-0005 [Flavobacterium psychrophilum]GAW89393.1 hypothetical protein FPS14_contig00020-0053 [Flavobacterium psychrophilum]GEJ31975.1 hypothetical protein FPN181_contig00060-0037 [Flavobacterium psychrophilum]